MSNKKAGFNLVPITLNQPIKVTDGFTNLVDPPQTKEITKPATQKEGMEKNEKIKVNNPQKSKEIKSILSSEDQDSNELLFPTGKKNAIPELETIGFALTEQELLRILDAESYDEIYELSDVLRASSLKLYATLMQLADSKGRTRVKNHELMSKAGIKGIATLYKQERWLMDLKLLEKKAKPGPHDGSSYVVYRLETLPLPSEIYQKFNEYLVKMQS